MPNITAIVIACFLFCTAVFTIASSSIGIECGNSTDYKTKKKDNMNALIAFVVMGVLCLLCSGLCVIAAVRLP
jgi:hypothetical protein